MTLFQCERCGKIEQNPKDSGGFRWDPLPRVDLCKKCDMEGGNLIFAWLSKGKNQKRLARKHPWPNGSP